MLTWEGLLIRTGFRHFEDKDEAHIYRECLNSMFLS